MRASAECVEDAGKLSRRQIRRDHVAEEQRATRALKFVQLSELSAARQVLKGTEVAPGIAAKLRAFRDRHAKARDDIPEFPRPSLFSIAMKICSARMRGQCGGPSGKTHDHFRPLLESPKDLRLFFAV